MGSQTFSSKLDFVVTLLRSLENVSFKEDRSFEGTLLNDSLLTYQDISKHCYTYDIDNGNSNQKSQLININTAETRAYWDLEHYLSSNTRRLDPNPSQPFYIFKLDTVCDVNNTHPEVEKIFIIANLFSKLRSISDTQNNNGNSTDIIFVGKKNLKINSNYGVDTLSFDPNKVNLFIKEYFENEIYHEDRILAIKNALHETFPDNEITLAHLMKNFSTFSSTVKNNFQLFMDQFSFEKLKDECNEVCREYTLKINKIFSDLQNQLLTLPIATVLAAGQMSKYTGASDLIKNSLIVFGILVFCFLLLMQVSNQKDSLKTIHNEIALKEIEFKKLDESEHKNLFLNICTQLTNRMSSINCNLEIVQHITIVSTLLVIFVYLLRFVW